MKVTPKFIQDNLPFLSGLLVQAAIQGRRKIQLEVKTTPIEIRPTFHDGMVRHTSMGHIAGQTFTRYAGCSESTINSPSEMIGDYTPFDGKAANPGCFYAVLDLLEYYGMRLLTVYLNETDVAVLTGSVRNQLGPFVPHLLQAPVAA